MTSASWSATGIALLACAASMATAGSGDATRSRPTSASTCALQIPNRLVNRNSLASTRLVPASADSLLLCRYGGLNAGSNAGRLTASVTVKAAATIQRLTSNFNALPRQRAGFHCPMDDGSAIIATFGYANGAPDPVQFGLKGCRTVSNSRLRRTASSPTGAALVNLLERLLQPAATIAPHPCASSQLAVSVQTQGENTTAWIGVTVQNRGIACALTKDVGRVSLLVEQEGRPANVGGNPLTLFASGRLQHGGTRLLIADWGNWCGSRRAIRLAVTLGGSTTRARFSTLPVCLQPRQRSRLSAVH
jgi:hypothetical protein